VLAHLARAAALFLVAALVACLWGWAKTPQAWIYLGIGCLLGLLAVSGCKLAYRRLRGTGLGEKLADAARARARTREARACTRARARAAGILQARASAGSVIGSAGNTADSFPRRKLGPG
jgi:hypothetical protein